MPMICACDLTTVMAIMSGKQVVKLHYRAYQEYPPELLAAARFRDQHPTEGLGVGSADYRKLAALRQWEKEFTDVDQPSRQVRG